jgi:glycosyltransferase involved in cell wall biosynthesis
VFSSFKLYGWEERDRQYAPLIEQCKQHPAINYHGSRPNDVVRKALAEAHIFAYPSIWMETSCICAMEAMSAGCTIVCPNLAALPETTAGFARMYQWDEDPNRHARRFYDELKYTIKLIKALQDDGVYQPDMFQKLYADSFYGWDTRKGEWTRLLQSL